MRNWGAIAAALFASPWAQAHDFWIDFNNEYHAAPRAPLAAAFLVGHAGDSENWTLKRERIAAFRAIGPQGVLDIQGAIRFPENAAPGGARLSLPAEGAYVVAFESTPAEIELDATKFEAYLKEEGLTPAIEARQAAGRTNAPGRELYSRRAKAIIQIGDASTENVSRPIGQTLEITPTKNPLLLEDGEPLTVEVRYYGRPLGGASVHLESLSVGFFPEATKVTAENGRAAFAFPHKGAWKLDVVWTEPIEHPRAEFNTIFASLTFGYRDQPRSSAQ